MLVSFVQPLHNLISTKSPKKVRQRMKCHIRRARMQDKVTGRFVPGSCLAAWPFHLALHARIRLRRARTKEPLYQLVEDGWYISGWPYCASVLPNEENLAVVDCTCEYPRCHDKPYLCIPTWDTQGALFWVL
jgi:hypothetical protein